MSARLASTRRKGGWRAHGPPGCCLARTRRLADIPCCSCTSGAIQTRRPFDTSAYPAATLQQSVWAESGGGRLRGGVLRSDNYACPQTGCGQAPAAQQVQLFLRHSSSVVAITNRFAHLTTGVVAGVLLICTTRRAGSQGYRGATDVQLSEHQFERFGAGMPTTSTKPTRSR